VRCRVDGQVHAQRFPPECFGEVMAASRIVRLGMVQFVPDAWEVKRNWVRLKAILRAVPPGRMDLVITPECILDGYAAREAPKQLSMPWAGRKRWLSECALDPSESWILARAGALARRGGFYLVLGCTELVGEGKAANSAAVFDRRGRRIATYHKTHLQQHDLQFEPGKSWTIVGADFGKFGVLICADRRWPEAVRCQRLLGAELVAVPSYGMHCDLNLAMMRTRAYENGFFVAFAHPRQSLVTGPGGEVVVDVRSDRDALVPCTVDLDALNGSHIEDRRTDLYRCGAALS